jgi:hypothetical protein
LVTPGVNGYLFKPNDAEDAAHYMQLLANQPERWEEMGKASVEKARVHSLESTVQRYEEIYKKSLEEIPVMTSAPSVDIKGVKPSFTSQESVLTRREKH